jgi:adenine-specific DNA methylase
MEFQNGKKVENVWNEFESLTIKILNIESKEYKTIVLRCYLENERFEPRKNHLMKKVDLGFIVSERGFRYAHLMLKKLKVELQNWNSLFRKAKFTPVWFGLKVLKFVHI